MSPPCTTSPGANPWLFFAAVFSWSWAFWIAIATLGISLQSTLGKALELLGLFGPALGGVAFTCLSGNRESRREYWARIVDPRRIRARWYLIIIFFAPVLWAVAVALDIASGESEVLVQIRQAATPLLTAPATIVPFLAGIFLYGPIPEEPGWRGYGLDRLQERWSALVSSLMLGAIWAIYHVPLFYMEGGLHHDRGAWSTWFWLFVAQVMAASVIFTWIFNNTRRSTLGAILFHFMLNLTAQLVNLTPTTNFYATLLWIAAAGGVAGAFGAATLTGNGSTASQRPVS